MRHFDYIINQSGSTLAETTNPPFGLPTSWSPECDETRHKSESSPTENKEHKQFRENTYENNTLSIYTSKTLQFYD